MRGRIIESYLSTIFLFLLLGYGYWIGYIERKALTECGMIVSGEVIKTVGRAKGISVAYFYYVEGKRYVASERKPKFYKKRQIRKGQKLRLLVSCSDPEIVTIEDPDAWRKE